MVFHEGQEGDLLYIIVRGSVSVLLPHQRSHSNAPVPARSAGRSSPGKRQELVGGGDDQEPSSPGATSGPRERLFLTEGEEAGQPQREEEVVTIKQSLWRQHHLNRVKAICEDGRLDLPSLFGALPAALDRAYERASELTRQNAVNLLDVLTAVEVSAPKIGIPGLDDILVEGVHQYMAFLLKSQGDKGGVMERIAGDNKYWVCNTIPMLELLYKHILENFVKANCSITIECKEANKEATALNVPAEVSLKRYLPRADFELLAQSYCCTRKDREHRRAIVKRVAEPLAHTICAQLSSIVKQMTAHNVTQHYEEVGQLRTGQSFGEKALIENKPRAATIRCREPCFFAVLSKNDYNSSIGKMQKQQADKLIQFLQDIP